MALIPQEIVDKAKKADLLSYLQHKGYNLISDTKTQNGKAYRLAKHDSLVISNNMWFWFSQNYGGNTLDFLVKYEGKKFREAVEELAGGNIKTYDEITTVGGRNAACSQDKDYAAFELPEKAENFRRVFAYLSKSRYIDSETISELMHKNLIYESKDNHNCVFVGLDKEGAPKYANLRGTLSDKPFKKDCFGSNKRFSFSISGTNNTLRVFEGAIDAISDISLSKYLQPNVNPYDTHRLSLGGVEALALYQYLSDHLEIKNIILRLDNDPTGRDAAEKIMADLIGKGYDVDIKHPKEKDVNADLISFSSRHDLSDFKVNSSVYNKINQVEKFMKASQNLRSTINQERKGDKNVKRDR